MQLLPYKQILKMGKDVLKESLVPIRAMQAKKQAELEMCRLDEKIATLEACILENSSAHPVNFYDLINKQDELALFERKKSQLEKIITEMFPD